MASADTCDGLGDGRHRVVVELAAGTSSSAAHALRVSRCSVPAKERFRGVGGEHFALERLELQAELTGDVCNRGLDAPGVLGCGELRDDVVKQCRYGVPVAVAHGAVAAVD